MRKPNRGRLSEVSSLPAAASTWVVAMFDESFSNSLFDSRSLHTRARCADGTRRTATRRFSRQLRFRDTSKHCWLHRYRSDDYRRSYRTRLRRLDCWHATSRGCEFNVELLRQCREHGAITFVHARGSDRRSGNFQSAGASMTKLSVEENIERRRRRDCCSKCGYRGPLVASDLCGACCIPDSPEQIAAAIVLPGERRYRPHRQLGLKRGRRVYLPEKTK
jgi:hypothetical protein